MPAYVTTTTGARIGQVLDSIDFTEPGSRDLDIGDTIIAPAPDGTKSALDIIQDLLTSERGAFYISRAGTAVFDERAARAKRTTSSGTITSAVVRSDTGFELDGLKNRVTVKRTNPADGSAIGTPQTAQNETSVNTYGVSDASEITTAYLSPQTDETALSLAQYIVNIQQSYRKPIEVELHANDVATSALQLMRELQDRVTVSNSQASGDWHIESIKHLVRPGSFITTFGLSDRGAEAFVIDTSTFDSTTDLITY